MNFMNVIYVLILFNKKFIIQKPSRHMTGQSYIFFYMNIYEFIWIYINKFIYICLYLILPFTLYLSSDLLWLPIIMRRFFREPLRVLWLTFEGFSANLWRFFIEPLGSPGNLCAGIVSNQLLNHHVLQCCTLQQKQIKTKDTKLYF